MTGARGWRFHNPVAIRFGPGLIDRMEEYVSGGKLFLVTSPGWTRRGLTRRLGERLGSSLAGIHDQTIPNPDFRSIRGAYEAALGKSFHAILAVGGGSVLDTAKALAASLAGGGADWLEAYVKGKASLPAGFTPAPIHAIPTTSGTGSEVTMWGTVWDMEEKRKYSISHPALYPARAILDPDLTHTLPEAETVQCGLDALSHAMEAIWNRSHNPVSDNHALRAISLVFAHLPKPASGKRDSECRSGLMEASLLAGLASSNTRTALAHSISYPLTARFGLPHGLACSLPLPHLLRFNAPRAPDRIGIMAGAMGADGTGESMAQAVLDLFRRTGTPATLAEHGISKDRKPLILSEAVTPGRADNNIADFTSRDLEAILEAM